MGGKHKAIVHSGCHVLGCDICGCIWNYRKKSLRLISTSVKCETKTKDDVFATVQVDVQYRLIPDKAYDAIYRLSTPDTQIQSFVLNELRAEIPKMSLDETFESKDEIAKRVQEELEKTMTAYGYEILAVLVTDVEPDRRVKDAMNEKNAAKRMRAAAFDKAEAEKVMMVKQAEAEAEAKFLLGQGVAKQRGAIVNGLRDCVVGDSDDTLTAAQVTELLLITQYFDTMQSMASGTATTVFMPHNVGSLRDVAEDIRNGVMQASAAR